jgi:hypothetical protein
MFISSWFRPTSKRPRPTTRLAVEQLEDRCVPSAGGGSYLLVSSYKTDNVLRYDAATGAFVDEFIPHRSGGLNQPWSVLIGPADHDVYVSTGHFGGPGQIKAVLRYDGTTGAFLDEFAQRGQLSQPGAAVFGPDGNIYVSDCFTPHQGSGRPLRRDYRRLPGRLRPSRERRARSSRESGVRPQRARVRRPRPLCQ